MNRRSFPDGAAPAPRPLRRMGSPTIGPLVWAAGIAFAALFIAGAILVSPAIAAGLVAAGIVVVIALVEPVRYRRAYVVFGTAVLIGYAMLGRGFAYIGFHPLFVGEMAFGLGLVALLVSGRGLVRTLRSPVVWLVLAYMAWGAWRTLPYIGVHGTAALRDGVLWGYGAFVVIVAAVLLETGLWRRAPGVFRAWLPWLILWLPFAYLASEIYQTYLPRLPGSQVTIPQLKPGDVAVHLAGAGAFLVLGLHRVEGQDRGGWLEWVMWAFWATTFVVSATQNRGGMVATTVALGLIMIVRPSWRWFKILLAGGALIALLVAVDASYEIDGRREVSARQLAANAASVFGVETGVGEEDLRGTVDWRQQWWGDIVGYTFGGPYFWTGKGFGVNLATSDGYQVAEDESLRSPHNGHLTVLARAGVPGFVLWCALQATFAGALLLAYVRARGAGRDGWARVDLWILAYWTAFVVNGTFDVFLEGPQGGIWFWSLMGLGVTMLEIQRREGIGT